MATFKPENVIPGVIPAISKALRLKILLDRKRGKFGNVDRKGPYDAYHHEDAEQFPTVTGAGFGKNHRKEIRGGVNDDIDLNDKLGYLFQTPGTTNELNRRTQGFKKDFIALVDLDFDTGNKSKKYKTLVLPFVPKQLDYNPDSNFVGIATMGRNNPHYHYTGSEDTLEFTIDWHSELNHRQDVIYSCRWLEAMSKGDSYEEAPHRLKLVWGEDNIMFDKSIWLVVNAKYTLTEFVDSYRRPGSRKNFGKADDKPIVKVGMMPQQAIQTVTLKRITEENRTTAEIIDLESISEFDDTTNRPVRSVPRFY